jgi:membrane protein implicated in regulation of membrane protease activity
MASQYYYKKRLPLLGVSIAAFVVVLLFSPLFAGISALLVVVGFATGYLAAWSTWRQFRKRIDRRNALILYVSDGFWYAFALPLYLLSQTPVVAGRLPFHIADHPAVAYGALLVVLSMNVGYNVALYKNFRRHERSEGSLKIKEYYAPSITGAEGMLGKSATVVEECNPQGKVRFENELWNAKSLEGQLKVGERVVVRDLVGLTLIVEAQTQKAT